MASHDALNWYVTFVSYVPESSAWLIFGILLVVCSTERVGPTDYVGYLLSLKVNGKKQPIGRIKAFLLKL
jgi:hypothetical protein